MFLDKDKNILLTGFIILVILSAILYTKDLIGKEIVEETVHDFKIDNTTFAFFLIFPQLFAGFSLYKFKFKSLFRFFRFYHKIFGFVLIGIYLIVSFFCIYFEIPLLNEFPGLRVFSHIVFGLAGYMAILMKIFWVVKKSAYSGTTALLGSIIAITLTGLFISSVLLHPKMHIMPLIIYPFFLK